MEVRGSEPGPVPLPPQPARPLAGVSTFVEKELDPRPAPPKSGYLGSYAAVQRSQEKEMLRSQAMEDARREWEMARSEMDINIHARTTKRLLDAMEERWDARLDRVEGMVTEMLELMRGEVMVRTESGEGSEEESEEEEGAEERPDQEMGPAEQGAE